MGAPVARGSRGVLCTWTTQVWKSTRRADVMLKHEVEVEVEEERRPERNISDYMWCCYVGKCIERDVSRWRRRCRSVPGLSPHAHRHQDASVEESARRARARAHTREARGTHSRRAFGTLASTRAAAANECTFFNFTVALLPPTVYFYHPRLLAAALRSGPFSRKRDRDARWLSLVRCG